MGAEERISKIVDQDNIKERDILLYFVDRVHKVFGPRGGQVGEATPLNGPNLRSFYSINPPVDSISHK